MSRVARAPHLCLIAFFAALGLGEGLAQGALGALLAAVLIALALREDRNALLRAQLATWSTRALLAFIVWAIVTMWLNRYGPPRSRDGTKLFNLLPLLAVPLALRLSPLRARKDAALALFLALGLASVLGILQYRFGVTWLAELSGAHMARWQLPIDERGERFMASGFFYNRLKFSGVLLAALSLAVFTVPVLAKRRSAFFASLLMFVGLLLSFSRAAALALVAGCSMLSRRAWLALAGLGAFTAAVLALVPGLGERLGSVAHASAYADRFFLWARAQEIIGDHPWVGVGYGNYGEVCGPYYDRVDPGFVMRSQAHNQFLTVLAETGPLGLALFSTLLVCVALDARGRRDAFTRGSLAALVSFAVLCLTHDPLFSPVVALAFSAVWGLGQHTNLTFSSNDRS